MKEETKDWMYRFWTHTFWEYPSPFNLIFLLVAAAIILPIIGVIAVKWTQFILGLL